MFPGRECSVCLSETSVRTREGAECSVTSLGFFFKLSYALYVFALLPQYLEVEHPFYCFQLVPIPLIFLFIHNPMYFFSIIP